MYSIGTVLYDMVLYYTVQYRLYGDILSLLFDTVLYCVLYCTVLYGTVVYDTILYGMVWYGTEEK